MISTRPRGFEIFSVSVDDEKRDWVKAIEKDKITWLQVNDPRNWGAQSALTGIFQYCQLLF